MKTQSPPIDPESLSHPYRDLSPEQIQRLVKKGQAIRAHYLATSVRSWYRELKSVFRRPGRILPTGQRVHFVGH